MKKIIITESQLKKIITEKVMDQIYYETFSQAVQTARQSAEDKGFDLDENDWSTEITFGPGKPDVGQTIRASIGLTKNGKQQKKELHIQVYNRGHHTNRPYELNFYIS
jgi:hypothetical protein